MFRPEGAVAIAVGVASVSFLVGAIAALPVFLVRIPSDYFVRPAPERPVATRVARAVLGVVLIVLGCIMLVLPGQGILTILVGLVVLGLPVGHRLARRLISRRAVFDATNRLRARFGRPPLIVADACAPEGARHP